MEKIIFIALELERTIKKKYNTITNFCENTKRNKMTFICTLNRMKKGEGCNLKTLLKLTDDLGLELVFEKAKKK